MQVVDVVQDDQARLARARRLDEAPHDLRLGVAFAHRDAVELDQRREHLLRSSRRRHVGVNDRDEVLHHVSGLDALETPLHAQFVLTPELQDDGRLAERASPVDDCARAGSWRAMQVVGSKRADLPVDALHRPGAERPEAHVVAAPGVVVLLLLPSGHGVNLGSRDERRQARMTALHELAPRNDVMEAVLSERLIVKQRIMNGCHPVAVE